MPSPALGETRGELGKVSSLLREAPRAFCIVTLGGWGRGRRLGITGHKVLPVSQGPFPTIRMWGGWLNE